MKSCCDWFSYFLIASALSFHLSICQANKFDYDALKEFDFRAFLQKHQKVYSPLELASHANVFYQRTLDIFKANVLYVSGQKHHYLRQNGYLDLLPQDVKRIFSTSSQDELPPVKEANINPNIPADRFIASKSPASYDIETQSSLDSLSISGDEPVPVIDFLSEPDKKISPSRLLHELSEHPDLAKKMSQIINLSPKSNSAGKFEPKEKFEYKHNIPATNKAYDPSLVVTRGFGESRKFHDAYAHVLMEEFLGYIEPYPEPQPIENYFTPDQQNGDHDEGILSGFVGSIKNLSKYFSIADPEGLLEEESSKSKKTATGAGGDSKSSDTNESGISYKIDWRTTGCIPRLKDQKQCNSCYAFAALDILEYFYCRQMKVKTEFSVQYLIDCGQKTGMNGCEKGRLSDVRHFITNYGLQIDSLYPYTAKQQQCPYDDDTIKSAFLVKPTIKRWALFSEIQAWYRYISMAPVIVGINIPADFLAYGGGIHNGLDCTPGMGHAMVLVGAGKENGKPFWLLKNTFSEDWGEKGYFRLSRKAPIKCFDSVLVGYAEFDMPERGPPAKRARKS
jgi:hypothetical protein